MRLGLVPTMPPKSGVRPPPGRIRGMFRVVAVLSHDPDSDRLGR